MIGSAMFSWGAMLIWCRGSSIPCELVRHSNVVFHGHILAMDPLIRPISEAIVMSWCFLNSQLRIWENIAIPITAPAIKIIRVIKSLSFTAERICEYFPMMSRRNDPEIPGRIMAQMAIIPEMKNARGVSGVWVGESVAMRYPIIVVTGIAMILVMVQVLILREMR